MWLLNKKEKWNDINIDIYMCTLLVCGKHVVVL